MKAIQSYITEIICSIVCSSLDYPMGSVQRRRIYWLAHCQQPIEGRLTYQSPFGERSYSAAATSDSKRIYENHNLSASVESRTEQEVILPEPSSPILAEIPLRKEGE